MVQIAIVLALLAFFWFTADAVYESHLRTRENHPTLFFLTGINGKYIDDRKKWIYLFKRKVVLAVLLFLAVVLAIYFR